MERVTNRTHYAVEVTGGGRSSAISRRMSANRFLVNRDIGHLEGDIAAVADDLRADLDEFLLEARQRPIFDRLGRRQRAQEVAEIIGERMKLKPHGVGGERAAGEPRPSDRALALFDPLLARAALVVEGDDILGGASHVGDNKADARVKFARMPFDLGDDAARLSSSFRPDR